MYEEYVSLRTRRFFPFFSPSTGAALVFLAALSAVVFAGALEAVVEAGALPAVEAGLGAICVVGVD